MRRHGVLAVAIVAFCLLAPAAGAQVLRVGSYRGVAGQFASIQAAVDAARPGDWILIGPGDYHEVADHRADRGPQPANTPAAVVIAKADLYLRGMNRNTVVVDGSKPGAPRCGSGAADQDLGQAGADGSPLGRNGILVWKAPDVWVQNLTACNFLGGSGDAGNAIWWNGGDRSAQVGGFGFSGSYLTTTSSFYGGEHSAAQYGIFSSNWSGGTWDHAYASNFNDSGFYIGACQQICNQTVNHVRSEYNALGYSGSNSGGRLVVKNSEFDQNEDGFDTNSQNGDDPSPQNGACPGNAVSPITHTHSCWVFMNNYVHDNNNPNVPSSGLAGVGPVGTGMSLSGGRNDTIVHNRFERNGAWGMIVVPFPDTSGPPCRGGASLPANLCWFEEWGNAVLDNSFAGNGYYGNPTNGDLAQFTALGGPSNCYAGNTAASGAPVTTSPAGLQQSLPKCGPFALGNLNATFFSQVGCDSQVSVIGLTFPCLGGHYPRRTQIVMHPLPAGLATMPHPCAGVPVNPWCGGQRVVVRGCAGRAVSVPLALATRERLESLSARVDRGKWVLYQFYGGVPRTISVPFGGRRGTVTLTVAEYLRVGRHRETLRFTRVYHRC